jgi:hypothetical protein
VEDLAEFDAEVFTDALFAGWDDGTGNGDGD